MKFNVSIRKHLTKFSTRDQYSCFERSYAMVFSPGSIDSMKTES